MSSRKVTKPLINMVSGVRCQVSGVRCQENTGYRAQKTDDIKQKADRFCFLSSDVVICYRHLTPDT